MYPYPAYLSLPLYPHLQFLPPTKKEKNVTVEAVVCHGGPTAHPFVHTSLLVNVGCNDSLVWYEGSGFCSSVDAGTSPGLLSGTLLLPWRLYSSGYVGLAPSCTSAAHQS